MPATRPHRGLRSAALALVPIALALPASGCTILFSAIGSGIPAGSPAVQPMSLRAVADVPRGERLWVATVDGDTVMGEFVALDETPPARYALRIRDWRARHAGAPGWPQLGEPVRVRLAGLRGPDGVIEGRFGGFGHLGLRVRQPGRTVSLGYADTDSLIGVGAVVRGDSLAAWDARIGLPSFSVLRLDTRGRSGFRSMTADDDGAGTTKVVLTASARVGRRHRPTHAVTGFAAGALADLLLVLWASGYAAGMR